MAWTEFYCQSGGSNLNAGSTTNNTATFTYASGSWVSTTRVFTVASGNPLTDGVAVGDFASVYADGSTATGFVARVTARDATTITLSTTVDGGSAPSNGTNTRTLKIGGAWLGPTGTSAGPFAVFATELQNVSGHLPRFNLKNDADYAYTSGPSLSGGPYRVQGYTSSPGDGGRATLTRGTTGTTVTLSAAGSGMELIDLNFDTNGTTSANAALSISGTEFILRNIVFSNHRGFGLTISGDHCVITDCEWVNCNTSNAATTGGIGQAGVGNLFLRCVMHDNVTANSSGMRVTASSSSAIFMHCIFYNNGLYGASLIQTTGTYSFINCDFFANTSDGVNHNAGSPTACYFENCNFIDNGGWGLNAAGAGAVITYMRNCAFGTGTMANASVKYTGMKVTNAEGEVDYATDTHPWADPTNGDFSITLEAAKNKQYTFFQTQGGPVDPYTPGAGIDSPTKSFSDIGAGQAECEECVGGGGTEHSFVG